MQELDRRININNLEEYENSKIKIRKNDQSQIEGQYSLFEDKN